jgi:hypothetical protein
MKPSLECKRFNSCSAPICPLYEGGIWYPDEEICALKEYAKLGWIKYQKKIKRMTRVPEFFFTLRMLERNCIIGRAIEGLDPDHDLNAMERDEANWLKKHPKKPEISEAKREELKNRVEKARHVLTLPEKDAIRIDSMRLHRHFSRVL